MDLSSVFNFVDLLKIMGMLLTLIVLIIVIRLVWAGGDELVRQLPSWVKARFENRNASLASRPNSWTDILKRREFLGIADWFITRFTVIGVIGIFAAAGAAWLQCDFALGVRVLALSILFGAASLLGGWLLGLLFGVPRALVGLEDAAPPPAATTAVPVAPIPPAAPVTPVAPVAPAADEGEAAKPDAAAAAATKAEARKPGDPIPDPPDVPTTPPAAAPPATPPPAAPPPVAPPPAAPPPVAPPPAVPAAPAANPPAGRSRRRKSGVNTNLTDISDWLTKTIVGVGLTQLYGAPHYLWTRAGYINDTGFKWTDHGQLLVLALFVYFSIGGFWLGYVATRTMVTALLDQIDGGELETTQAAVSLHELNIGYSGAIDPAPPGSLLAQADAALLNIPRDSLTSALQLAAWGAAQARAGQMPQAREALETAHAMAPDDAVYRQLLLKVRAAMGDRKGSQALGTEPWVEVFNALYERAPHGFTTAILKGEALAVKEQEAAPKSASLHLWLASAYGQKYAYEKAKGAPPATLDPIRDRALAEAKAALDIDLAVRPTLQALWDPPPGAADDDLAVFKDDPQFKALLG